MKIAKNKEPKIREILAERRIKKGKEKKTYIPKEEKPELTEANKVYRSKINHDAFLWMLKTILFRAQKGNVEEIDRVIKDNWRMAFGMRPFPVKGGNLQELQLAIRYEYMRRGFSDNDLPISETFRINHEAAVNFRASHFSETSRILNQCDGYSKFSGYFIGADGTEKLYTSENDDDNLTQPFYLHSDESEDSPMATKKSSQSTGSTKSSTPKESKKLSSTGMGMTRTLLMERKHTDDEILERVIKEHPSFPRRFISCKRSEINAGRSSKFDVGENPLERLVRDEKGKLVPASSVVKEEKTPAPKKDSKKATGSKKVAKKTQQRMNKG